MFRESWSVGCAATIVKCSLTIGVTSFTMFSVLPISLACVAPCFLWHTTLHPFLGVVYLGPCSVCIATETIESLVLVVCHSSCQDVPKRLQHKGKPDSLQLRSCFVNDNKLNGSLPSSWGSMAQVCAFRHLSTLMLRIV